MSGRAAGGAGFNGDGVTDTRGLIGFLDEWSRVGRRRQPGAADADAGKSLRAARRGSG